MQTLQIYLEDSLLLGGTPKVNFVSRSLDYGRDGVVEGSHDERFSQLSPGNIWPGIVGLY